MTAKDKRLYRYGGEPGTARVVALSGLANVSDGIRLTVGPLLALLLTDSAILVAIITAANGLPWLLGGGPSGLLLDKYNRVQMVRIANSIRVAAMLVLAALWNSGSLTIASLVMVVLVVGFAEVVVDNGTQAIVGDQYPAARLVKVTSMLVAAQTMGNEFVGPAAAGGLWSVDPGWAILVGAGLCVPGALLTLGTPSRLAEEDQLPESRALDLRSALRPLKLILLLGLAFSLADSMVFAVLVVHLVQAVELSPALYGPMLSFGALGGLLGSLLAPTLYRRGDRVALATPLVAAGLGNVLLAVAGGWQAAAGGIIAAGFGLGAWTSSSTTIRQRDIVSGDFGRINGTYGSIVTGAAPVGALIGGAIATVSSTTTVVVVATVLLLVAIGWGSLQPGEPKGGVSRD